MTSPEQTNIPDKALTGEPERPERNHQIGDKGFVRHDLVMGNQWLSLQSKV